ncbi:hypothetical protein DFJ74DRAFT_601162 [Hyaloraphidium curvatum]|nr:hypothetical protein DFJ74DRAFT_601162 [Hyaloraphidium curvatum]
MAEAAKGTRSVAVDPRKNTPLCPFAVAGTCKMGDRCRYIHGIVCPSCHRAVLHPADSAAEHQAHIFECEKTVGANEDAKAKLEASKSLECGICFTEVMSRKDPRFGLLRCEHAFCIECIRGWRSTHAQDERLSCPSCRVPTPFITPSTIWLTGPEKEAAIEKYKQALGRIECKWWNYGRGTCPFGTSCFYAHTDRAGNVVKMELRSAQTSEGTGVVLNAPKLSDFLFPE